MHFSMMGSQVLPAVQSVSAAHDVAHTSPPHWYGSQSFVFAGGHWPCPSQPSPSVIEPSTQLGSRHGTADPANPAHDKRSTPSQRASEHGSLVDPAAHAGRAP